MSGLEVFMAGNNELVGTIPIEIGRLSSLRIVELYENKLTGNIPDFVSTDLRQVHVDNNDLSGTIPFFDDGVPLEQIRLERNRLHGNLPIRLGDHTDLVVLHLNGNGFSGIVPHEYGRLEHLESFKLEGNTLTGTVPESICELILFHSLSTFNPKCDGSNVAFICDCCTACH